MNEIDTSQLNLINNKNLNNNNVNLNEYEDIKGKIVFDPIEGKNNCIEVSYAKSLDDCKNKCSANKECTWIQYGGIDDDSYCYLYTFNSSDTIFQWSDSEEELRDYNIPFNTTIPIKNSDSNPKECHNKCSQDSNCLYSTFTIERDSTSVCSRYYYLENSFYTLSYLLNPASKLNGTSPLEFNVERVDNLSYSIDQDFTDEVGNNSKSDAYFNSITLYGLTIVILVLIAIILCICKRRSDNEKILLYTLSNVTANSQSRSLSKSSPSENMSYLNSTTNLSSTFFQNTFNASSITINPDAIENSSKIKNINHSGSNLKKSSRKSTSSRAPSIHSVSTLCTSASVNNGTNNINNLSNTNENTPNEKGHHNNLSLSTKKSSYNYSIKTFSAKDPSLTGLSQNIKTLFANSYATNGMIIDNNSYFDNYTNFSNNNSPKIDTFDNLLYKENVNPPMKNIYSHHRKQSSSISISIPKVASSSSINVSPKSNGGVVSVTSPQQPKIVKIKKPVHTKQFSISRSVYSEPVLPINTANSDISIQNDDFDGGASYMDGQESIPFTTNNTNINPNSPFYTVNKIK